MPREALLARTMVELAEMLDVSAAGLMLVAPRGDLRVVASSSEEMRLVELFELQSLEGPCPDCYRTGEPSLNPNLATENGRWPRFAPVALAAHLVVDQLNHALNSRIMIEQAKGILAERTGLDMDGAFSWLRNPGPRSPDPEPLLTGSSVVRRATPANGTRQFLVRSSSRRAVPTLPAQR